nr:MAG TPA: hypothetical protein [Caudoviricetes sp.]
MPVNPIVNAHKKSAKLTFSGFSLVNLPIPHANLTVMVSQDFFTVRIRRQAA